MNTRLVAELKKIAKKIKEENKKIRINNYVKEKGGYRIKEGRCNLVIDTQVPSYDILLNQSLNQLNKVSTESIKSVASKYNVDQDVVKKQLESLKNSIRKRINNYKDSDPDDKYVYFGAGLKMKKDDSTIYIYGKKIQEQTIIKEEYKEKKSRVTTLIKDEFRNDLPHKLKTYKIKSKDFYKIKLI